MPSDDKTFCETAAKNILDTFGEEKIAALIATWDDLGVKGCLDAEYLILTAFVREFERRCTKGRPWMGGRRR